MQYRKMKKIDFNVSALGFGVMRLPSRKNPLDPRVDMKESIRMIRRAIDLGVNYFDTGWIYHFGQSEKILGYALQDGYRDKVFLVTKLPMFLVKKKEDFNRFLDAQLERLQTDHLDCYLFHALTGSGFDKMKNLSLIEEMEKAKAEGKIKHIGFSFHGTLPAFKNIVDFYDWDIAQIQYNYIDTTIQAQTEGLKYAHKKNIDIVIMEPLKGGMLANPPKEAKKILDNAPVKRTPVDWALQFLWNLQEVSVVLSGMSSMTQLEQNCESASNSQVGLLTEEENRTIDSIISIYQKQILVPCTSCKYCMPCPFGVNIPENFAIINMANRKSPNLTDKIWTYAIKRNYKKLSNSKETVNKKVPNGNASLCTECGKCVPLCPQQINIPEELKKVHSVMKQNKKIDDVFLTKQATV